MEERELDEMMVKVNFMEVGCEKLRWMELARDKRLIGIESTRFTISELVCIYFMWF